MKRTIAVLVMVILGGASSAYGIWEIFPEGAWPKTWPKPLEPLRKRSGTIQGSEANLIIHGIPFTKREDFEAAWPHLLKVKSKGAPIILVRAPLKHWHFDNIKTGVLIHSPPNHGEKSPMPEAPIAGVENFTLRWMWTTYIEVAVDGEVVDLNRIALPTDTPIIDKRFENEAKPAAK